MKNKIIRDSIHGYISIPDIIVDNLIDTEFFQRLRRIEQTSMRPLFPCARHDRFIHSIGVYYLGEKVFNAVLSNIKNNRESLLSLVDKSKKTSLNKIIDNSLLWENIRINFIIACLLHDVGHSPMSHTLEDQFRIKLYEGLVSEFKSEPQYWEELESGMKNCEISNCKKKVKEFISSGKPATHEVLSSIIVVKELRMNIENAIKSFNTKYNVDYEFIIRCIMGIEYDISIKKHSDDKVFSVSLKNAFINLLHGKVFDVDRLDYLKRDSYSSGMDSSNIDVERLINAVALYIDNDKFVVCINKSALSVIDEYIGAYNNLYLWVLNHHKVVLTNGLMRRTFKHISRNFSKDDEYIKSLFNYQNLKNNLLSDDDIWCEIKKYKTSIREASETITRGHSWTSVWKSVAEFRDLFFNLGAFKECVKGPIVKQIYTILPSFGFEQEFTKQLFKKINQPYTEENAQDIMFEKAQIKEMDRNKWTIPIIIDNQKKIFCDLMNVDREKKTLEKENGINNICFYAYIRKGSPLCDIEKNDFAKFLINFIRKNNKKAFKK